MKSMPWQNPSEWAAFLNFVEGYIKGHREPVVVEIGTYENKQKVWYEELGMKHIGVDIVPDYKPDIVGDSNDVATAKKLNDRLAGRYITLLFIDGHHTYDAVKRDYALYSIMTRGIVALHDIHNHNPQWDEGVPRFWEELTNSDDTELRDKTFITIHAKEGFANYGIGLVIKNA